MSDARPFTILPVMKKFHFYKFGTLLILLFPAYPVFGNSFYNSLPDNKREEIKIIDNHTVEVGIGSDNRSVSCNILDAIQSIPYVGSGGKPATVFVNKERIFLFHNKSYTWDRESKYRVRLTTKYIREFGNIRIHVPKEGATLMEEVQPAASTLSSSYHQNLPQNIKEEITIIDENMVEVAIGPDDRSISTTLLHAVKSIPSVKEHVEPNHVFVNDEPVHHIRKGIYAWDAEGKNPVKLATKYVQSFGNIKIHIIDEKTLSNFDDETEPGASKEPIDSPEPRTLPTADPNEKIEKEIQGEVFTQKKQTPEPEIIEPPSIVDEKSFTSPKPSSPIEPKIIKTGIVKGFRLAQFGMSEEQVIQAIEADSGLPEKRVEKRRDPESSQRILTLASLALDPANGKALVHYYLSSPEQTLNRVDVIWGHPDQPKVDPAMLKKSAKKFKDLFTQFRLLKTQTKDPVTGKGSYLFYGVDTMGNGIKMMWATPLDKNFKSIPKSEPALKLSYFLSQK